MKIISVNTRREVNKFIYMPYKLFKADEHWIPPLLLDQKNIFNPRKNNLLQHCDYQLFILKECNQIIGRIAVYINLDYNAYWKEKTGFFGHYECIDQPEASRILLETAQTWLQKRGMTLLRGPWNFVSQDFGLIIDGFELPPVILSSYNPPYYIDHMAQFGLTKIKDLLVYNCDIQKGYQIPRRFLDFTDKIAKRYRVNVRPINMKNLVNDARIIVNLTNESLANNWGFYPIALEEAEQIAADLKQIIHPELVLIAEVDGQAIGYVITLPDINTILKTMNGRLFPYGLFKLMSGLKKINRYRIWAMGIAKAYQRKGISVLLMRRLNDVLSPRKAYVEANYVLEDNHLMNNALVQLQFDQVKKYRVYDKHI
jgi:GNAT superfamily N-acetyltransferase